MIIRILVVDDHEIIRAGLKSLLRETDIRIVGEAATSEAAVQLTEKHSPDVVLVDVQMPGNDGLWALAKIKADRPDQSVLMWSAFDNPAFVARAVALGANGYVLKTATRDELVKEIRSAAAGDTTWTRAELRRVANALAAPRNLVGVEAPLTHREIEVLKELTCGATNKEIATTLKISKETVKEYVYNIFRKIGTTDRTQAAVWAARKKLV
jgi:DNA-binding NarL/FixJ family response regulator